MPPVYRVDRLERVLGNMCEMLPGVRGAVIVSVEGLVVASYPPADEGFADTMTADSSQVAAMASTLLSLSERTMDRLDLGDGGISRLLIEGSQGRIVIIPLSDEATLAIMLDLEAKVGVALFAAQRAAGELRQVLEGSAQAPLAI